MKKMVLAYVVALVAAQSLPLNPPQDDHLLELHAMGESEVPATEARVNARLEIIGREMPKAQESCEALARELSKQLVELGVEPRDLQLLEGGSGPSYDEDGKASRVAARRALDITLRDLKKAPQVLAVLSRGKTVTVGSVAFNIAHPEEAQLSALESAARRARRKADLLAAQLGFKLTRVYRVIEQNVVVPAPVTYAGPSISLPLSPPMIKATTMVTVIFELEGGAGPPKPAPAS